MLCQPEPQGPVGDEATEPIAQPHLPHIVGVPAKVLRLPASPRPLPERAIPPAIRFDDGRREVPLRYRRWQHTVSIEIEQPGAGEVLVDGPAPHLGPQQFGRAHARGEVGPRQRRPPPIPNKIAACTEWGHRGDGGINASNDAAMFNVVLHGAQSRDKQTQRM
jgi:hypothetical protein